MSMSVGVRRDFTREEDEMIIRQSTGEISLHKLQRWLGSSRETLERRAHELGIALHIQPRKTVLEPPSAKLEALLEPAPEPQQEMVQVGDHRLVFDRGDNPYRNEPDLLLDRLLAEHGDRRYSSIALKRENKC